MDNSYSKDFQQKHQPRPTSKDKSLLMREVVRDMRSFKKMDRLREQKTGSRQQAPLSVGKAYLASHMESLRRFLHGKVPLQIPLTVRVEGE